MKMVIEICSYHFLFAPMVSSEFHEPCVSYEDKNLDLKWYVRLNLNITFLLIGKAFEMLLEHIGLKKKRIIIFISDTFIIHVKK
jgi:hypothetical protein